MLQVGLAAAATSPMITQPQRQFAAGFAEHANRRRVCQATDSDRTFKIEYINDSGAGKSIFSSAALESQACLDRSFRNV